MPDNLLDNSGIASPSFLLYEYFFSTMFHLHAATGHRSLPRLSDHSSQNFLYSLCVARRICNTLQAFPKGFPIPSRRYSKSPQKPNLTTIKKCFKIYSLLISLYDYKMQVICLVRQSGFYRANIIEVGEFTIDRFLQQQTVTFLNVGASSLKTNKQLQLHQTYFPSYFYFNAQICLFNSLRA